jgi:hypothetical protein
MMARLFTGLETIDNWNPLDDGPASDFLPVQWHGPHVQLRLVDAWKTLNRMPTGQIRPKGWGNAWPSYRHEWSDLMNMIEDGKIEAYYRQANRVRILPSAREITMMEIIMEWPWKYLRQPRSMLIVNICAKVKMFDGNLQREIRKRHYGGNAEHWQKLNWKLCDRIADGLIRDRVAVF